MKYLLTLLYFTTFLFSSNTLTINQSNTPYTVGTYLSYYADETDSLSFKDIQAKEFIPHTKDIPNFGFLSSSYWFQFEFTYDDLMCQETWWLSIDYPLLDYIDFFILDTNTNELIHKKSGDMTPNSLKEVHQNLTLFSLPKKASTTYKVYLKVKTTSSMLVPIEIMSNKSLIKKTNLNQLITGMYYGILLILILYNIITFLFTREKVYALYVLFVISYALWQLSFDGLGPLYFWGDIELLREKGSVLFIYTSNFALLLFSQSLLKVNEYLPKYNLFLLQPLKYISLIGILAAIFLPYQYTIVLGALLAVAIPITLFSAGLIVLNKDYHSIKYFVLGWGVFLVATLLFTLSKFNLIQGYVIMKYGQQIGSAADMVLLSGALVQRFNALKDEYTKTLALNNKDLAAKVESALAKERHKDQMLMEQSRLASMGEMIEQIAHQWRQPLNNIGLINQDLYFKNILGTLSGEDFDKLRTQIDTNLEYMSNTIDDFRTYYRGGTEKEIHALHKSIDTILSIIEATFKHYKIKITLDIKEGVEVHTIKNELFQVFINILNNAKDALLDNEIQNKQISIELTSSNQYAYVKITDNGGGIPIDKISKIFDPYFTTKSYDGTGIGLYMSKNMIEKNMYGELSVENVDGGACFIIKLPLATS